jgi:hypothetical protein
MKFAEFASFWANFVRKILREQKCTAVPRISDEQGIDGSFPDSHGAV